MAVRFVSPGFAYLKIAGFLALQSSLAVLIVVCLWAVLVGSSASYRGKKRRDRPGRPAAETSS